jgi:uncharacterized protein YbbC (DUF1343 family)
VAHINGIDQFLADPARLASLAGRRIGLIGHPASLTAAGQHSLDALIHAGVHITAAFGPQHGMRGEKQDNMVESSDFVDARHGIPVYSLYGDVRRPTPAMLDSCDAFVFDLQDVGCRIYTFITTLRYFVEACAATGKDLIVLDRPNPAGRPIDGLRLEPGTESFVGSAALPTRHGLTVGELAGWFNDTLGCGTNITVVPMSGWSPESGPGYGWPLTERPWVNPSPNAASVNMTRCFPGTVLLEGTVLSEGRGTTVPLEVVGGPGIDPTRLLHTMAEIAPEWMAGALLRPCHFEPTFHKHSGALCSGFQIHAEGTNYRHDLFKPFRLIALTLKAIRVISPGQPLWREHAYEYEDGRLPIDVINGGPGLRTWVDDPAASTAVLAQRLDLEAQAWLAEREPFLLYE